MKRMEVNTCANPANSMYYHRTSNSSLKKSVQIKIIFREKYNNLLLPFPRVLMMFGIFYQVKTIQRYIYPRDRISLNNKKEEWKDNSNHDKHCPR